MRDHPSLLVSHIPAVGLACKQPWQQAVRAGDGTPDGDTRMCEETWLETPGCVRGHLSGDTQDV